MKPYQVVVTDPAWVEVQEAYEWLAERAPAAADLWKSGLLEAIGKLESLPAACPLAPETAYFGREIRQLLYGKRQHKYRVLFEIREKVVIVLRVRHGARKILGED
jgi:plasmid stabilization system protein ParE